MYIVYGGIVVLMHDFVYVLAIRFVMYMQCVMYILYYVIALCSINELLFYIHGTRDRVCVCVRERERERERGREGVRERMSE